MIYLCDENITCCTCFAPFLSNAPVNTDHRNRDFTSPLDLMPKNAKFFLFQIPYLKNLFSWECSKLLSYRAVRAIQNLDP